MQIEQLKDQVCQRKIKKKIHNNNYWYDGTKSFIVKKSGMKSSENVSLKSKTKQAAFWSSFILFPHLRSGYINADSHGISYACCCVVFFSLSLFFLCMYRIYTLCLDLICRALSTLLCARIATDLHVVCKQHNICHFGFGWEQKRSFACLRFIP